MPARAEVSAVTSPAAPGRVSRSRLIVLLAVLALLIPLLPTPGTPPAEALEDPRAWPQYLSDSGNTLRSPASGPSDPGLGWFVDYRELSTEQAPEGYALPRGRRGDGLPSATDGMLVLRARNNATGDRSVIGVDAADGSVQWEIPGVYDGFGSCEPAIDARQRVWLHPRGADHVIAHELETGEPIDGTRIEVDARCGNSALLIAGDQDAQWLVLPGGQSGPDFVPSAPPEQFTVVDITGDDPVVAWSFAPGEAPFDGTVGVSRGGTGGASNFFPRPMAADDETVYLVGWTDDGSEDGRHELFAFALADGELLGRTDAPAPPFDPDRDEDPIPATDYRRWQLLLTGDDELVVGPWTGSSDAFVARYDLTDGLDDAEPTWLERFEGASHPGRLALGNGVVHVQPDGRSNISGLDLATGQTRWTSEVGDGPGISTLGSLGSFAPVDADGAFYSRGNLTGGARSADVIKHDADGRLAWWFHQSTVQDAVRDALDDPGVEFSFNSLMMGSIDDEGTLYLRTRTADWLLAIDDSGGLQATPSLEDLVQDLWLLGDMTAVDEQGNDRDVLEDLVAELAVDAEDSIALSEYHTFSPTPALGAQVLDSDGATVEEIEVITGLIELTSLPEDSDVPDDLIGEATLMVVATTTDADVHVASGDQLAFDDTGLTALAGVETGHLTKAFGQTLPTGEAPGLDALETLERRWQQGSISFLTDDEGEGPAFRVATPFQREPAAATAGTALPRSGGGVVTTAIDKGLFTPSDVVFTAACTATTAATIKLGIGVIIGVACTVIGVGGTLVRIPEAIDRNQSPSPPPGPGGPRGGGWGDPHMTTFDGLNYDLHGQGEFHLVRGEDLEMQMRIAPLANWRNLAIISGMALDVAGDVIVTDAAQSPSTISINGEQVELDRRQEMRLPAGGTLTRWGGEVIVTWPDGTLIEITTSTRRQTPRHNVNVVLTPERAGAVVGLLGDADGDRDNDLTTADGQLLDNRDFTTFYDVYAESWRVDADDNLFDELTHDRSLPERQTTLADLDDDRVAWAERLCVDAGVTDAFLDACLIDVAATGDPSFAATATTAQAALRPGTLQPELAPVDDPEPDVPEPDPEPEECGTSFVDVTAANVHACAIDQLRERDITLGVGDERYDPTGTVTRGQFATFLVRALGLDPVADGPFDDTAGNVHEPQINAAAAAGITQGVTATSFAPDRQVTRGQVAALLTRAFDLDPVDDGPFDDTAGHTHEGRINAAHAAGITQGVSATSFAPDRELPRDQMASLLIRALDAAQDL